MSATRVAYLGYAISSDAHTRYDEPRPSEFDHPMGRFCVQKNRLTFIPAEDFVSVQDARAAVEPFLRAWETEAALKDMEGVIRFRYSDAEIKQLQPDADGNLVLQASVSSSVRLSDTLIAVVTKAAYPEPSPHFALTSDVDIATARWLGYRAGREPLLAVAYFILTVLETTFGSRSTAAASLAVDDKVLKTLGRLSSTAGDALTARKMKAASSPLLNSERAWLEAAIPMLIRRRAEQAAGATMQPIAMTDLPILPP